MRLSWAVLPHTNKDILQLPRLFAATMEAFMGYPGIATSPVDTLP